MAASNGYSRLKARYLKLQAENEELYARIRRQEIHISELVAKKANAESEACQNEIKCKRYWLHMGWFRRWLWERCYG